MQNRNYYILIYNQECQFQKLWGFFGQKVSPDFNAKDMILKGLNITGKYS